MFGKGGSPLAPATAVICIRSAGAIVLRLQREGRKTGGVGSGNRTERSTAWDYNDLCELMLAKWRRVIYDASAVPDIAWLAEQEARLATLQVRLKEQAIKRTVKP